MANYRQKIYYTVSMVKQPTPFIKRDLTLLTLVLIIIFGLFLGSRPLSVPDEGRYTEIPRQMVKTGDYVTPRLNGVKYFEKPPLLYWLTSASIKTFGINEWALRFWPAFFALIGCLATYLYAQRFFNRATGIASATVLASTLLYYAHSRILILDMPVASLLTCALFAFHAAVFETQKQRRYILLATFFTGSALALLTKGLIGIALPGGIILLWVAFTKRYDALKLAFHPLGILLFMIIALPWHILASLRTAEFFEFYIIHEQILRFLTDVHSRVQPLWFFIPIIILGLFPWISFLHKGIISTYKAIKAKTDQNNTLLFLVLWISFIFIFFSLSKSKLIPYIVPVFPPLAILIGSQVAKAWASKNVAPYRVSIRLFLGFAALFAIAAPIALYVRDSLDNMTIIPYAALTVFSLIGGMAAVTYLAHTQNIRGILVAIFCTAMGMFLPLNKAWVHIEGRSLYELTTLINKTIADNDTIVAWQAYYQDLPVYTGRRITVVKGFNELTFGTTIEDVSAWMIQDEDFTTLLDSGKPLYIVIPKGWIHTFYERYPHAKKLQILGQSARDILLTNKDVDTSS